jgi:pyruvate dehydrogenase (quinone)
VHANVPLIPPHLDRDQVLKTAKAEFSGVPAFVHIVEEGVRETVVSTVRSRLRHVTGSHDA